MSLINEDNKRRAHDLATYICSKMWNFGIDFINIVWFCRWRRGNSFMYDPSLDDVIIEFIDDGEKDQKE